MGSLSALQLGSLTALHVGSLIGSLQLANVAYLVAATGVVAVMVVELVLNCGSTGNQAKQWPKEG